MSKNILVLCTGNSARSIMAEGLFNGLGTGRVRAFSAGSKPVGRVNPLALEQLVCAGFPVAKASSKSWQVFAQADSQPMDIIMTVCANAAGETCPTWPGRPLTVHWGFDDPAAVEGAESERRAAFSFISVRYVSRWSACWPCRWKRWIRRSGRMLYVRSVLRQYRKMRVTNKTPVAGHQRTGNYCPLRV